MKTMTFAAWLAAVLLVIAGPVSAEKSCPAVPKGPGLVAADLIDDEGDTIGSFKAYNTTELMIFELYFDGVEPTDIQLYIAENMDRIPAKKGKPNFGKFPWQKKHFEFDGDKWELLLNLDEDLDFKWQGRSHFWTFMLHGDYLLGDDVERGFWAHGPCLWDELEKYTWFPTHMYHPDYGHFIDSPVFGLGYEGPTQKGVTGYSEDGEPIEKGGFRFFPDEEIHFAIDNTHLGIAPAAKKVSPLDLFSGADINDHRVISVARTLQTLDEDSGAFQRDGKLVIRPEVAACYSAIAGPSVDWADVLLVDDLLVETVANCNGGGAEGDVELAVVGPDDAQGNLEAGLNASGIFRKNISKTEDWGESKQKLEVMPVYFPGMRSNDDPSLCIDVDGDKIYDETDGDMIGVPYEEWRLSGDPAGEECDPRDYVDPNVCVLTLIECRDVAKPLLVSYVGKIDIYDDQVTTDFWPHRFSNDVYTAVSRDDGTTWKRMNLSRHADQSSIELETGEPFPGTASSPYLKVNDNKILVAWQSKFCDKGNPRYAINTCDDPATPEIEVDDPLTEEFECAIYCRGNPDQGTEVCEPDYPYDDDYYVTDIWGVRGHQRTVDYDEVDDVADLGIGEIPYSCLWVARGVIVTQKELDAGTFDSLNVADDPATEEDETKIVELGNIVWFKPERITSGRRDVYIPVVGSARGAGFAIAWQADPSGLRPGKGKGPGEGWSGAISNHKTDIWYTFISYGDFNLVDEGFVPAGPGDDATDDGGYLDKPGLGRPKALVPFTLPVRVTDNDMINTHTLKVAASSDCVIPPDGTNEACFPEVVDGSFTPILEDDISSLFCGHPDANPATCCDPNNHEGDPNCEDLKGFFGNLNGTKRYAYMARSIDEVDNTTGHYLPGGDGIPDYQYYVDRGGTLDLCDLSGANSYMDILPGTSVHERWYGFTNAAGASKLVCVSSDGRMIDGDVSASRPMLQLQPYTRPDGTKSAWALLAYEESKGMGHSLAAEAHEDTDNPVDDIIGDSGEGGQDKPFKQDIGKNLIYHSFDFTQPDLVSAGHMVNLPALCGGLYPTYCDDPKTPDIIEEDPDNPACTCTAGQPVPLYFDYPVDTDGDGIDDDWLPDADKFLQYRTEIARRARFIMQSPGKMGASKTLGAIIYKQGQEGQGRPADVFIRRMVKSGTGNPYKFGNFECTTWLDETFDLPGCPTDGVSGYNCNVWGEASGDRLCGGTFTDPNGGYLRRDHINLTSADIDMAVDAGPVDDTPDDPTDDRYGTNKVLLWSQHERNLGDESYGLVHDDGTPCDVLAGEVCPAMYSNARSHRGFIRGDFFATAFSHSPNWAAGRNGNDRYNFYVRRSFDGGQTWTTDSAGSGVYICPEYRSDPSLPDPDGSGNLPPEAFDESCGTYDETAWDGELPPMPVGIAMSNYLDPMSNTSEGVASQHIPAGDFEPARNVSEIKNNHVSSGDPRLGTTPPTYPLDGRDATLPILRFVEDEYINNMFFVAWGTVDNPKSTGSSGSKPEGAPLDLYYTRSEDYGDNYFKVPWVVGGVNSNLGYGETVWRYDYLAKGEPEEQGEAQLRATSDGSKAYAIYHQLIGAEEDPDAEYSRFYPWEPEESYLNDLWFRRLIFWPDATTTP